MFKIVDDEKRIEDAQQKFIKKFEPFIDKKIWVTIGYQGGSQERKVSWSSKLGIWMLLSKEKAENRYWNAFGIGEPSKGANVSIICEINFPSRGIDRSIGGAFVTDSSGSLIVVHRGKIGGGRKGIGKSLFEDNYRGEWIAIDENGVETKVALVGAMDSPRFVRQVSQFVFEVKRIKDLIYAPSQKQQRAIEFREEFEGEKVYISEKDKIVAKCDHGSIVTALDSDLERRGFKVGNNKQCDLFVVNAKGEKVSLFEIKTDISSTSIYCGVGQLLLNGVGISTRPKLILTIPKKVNKTLEAKLNKLGIELLLFRWRGDKVVFPKLDSFVRKLKRLQNIS